MVASSRMAVHTLFWDDGVSLDFCHLQRKHIGIADLCEFVESPARTSTQGPHEVTTEFFFGAF